MLCQWTLSFSLSLSLTRAHARTHARTHTHTHTQRRTMDWKSLQLSKFKSTIHAVTTTGHSWSSHSLYKNCKEPNTILRTIPTITALFSSLWLLSTGSMQIIIYTSNNMVGHLLETYINCLHCEQQGLQCLLRAEQSASPPCQVTAIGVTNTQGKPFLGSHSH